VQTTARQATSTIRDTGFDAQQFLQVMTALAEDIADGVGIELNNNGKSFMDFFRGEITKFPLSVAVDIAYDSPPPGYELAHHGNKPFIIRRGDVYIETLVNGMMTFTDLPAVAKVFEDDDVFRQFSVPGFELFSAE